MTAEERQWVDVMSCPLLLPGVQYPVGTAVEECDACERPITVTLDDTRTIADAEPGSILTMCTTCADDLYLWHWEQRGREPEQRP